MWVLELELRLDSKQFNPVILLTSHTTVKCKRICHMLYKVLCKCVCTYMHACFSYIYSIVQSKHRN